MNYLIAIGHDPATSLGIAGSIKDKCLDKFLSGIDRRMIFEMSNDPDFDLFS